MRWSLSFAPRVARHDRTWSYHLWGMRCGEQLRSLHVARGRSSEAARHHGGSLEVQVAGAVPVAAVVVVVAEEAADA